MNDALQGPLEGIATRVNRLLDKTVSSIIEIGQNLQTARGLLREDETFSGWLAENCPRISRTSAYRFISLAVAYPNGIERPENYDLSAVYTLAEPSTPQEVRDAAEACSNLGRHVDAAKVDELLQEHSEKEKEGEAEPEPEPEQTGDEKPSRPAREVSKTPEFWQEVERHLDRAEALIEKHAEDCDRKREVLSAFSAVITGVDDLKSYLS